MECRYTQLGKEYRGLKNTTKDGRACNHWGPDYRGGELADAENYCRNADSTTGGGPWCYNPSYSRGWEFCGVLLCGG